MLKENKVVMFLSLWVLNSLVFLVFKQIFGANVVLGNNRVAATMAVVFSGLLLTLATYAVEPLVQKSGQKVKDKRLMVIFYLVANVLGIWIIKRLERLTGVGISSTMYVVIIGVVATFAQWGVVKYIVPMLTGKKIAKGK